MRNRTILVGSLIGFAMGALIVATIAFQHSFSGARASNAVVASRPPGASGADLPALSPPAETAPRQAPRWVSQAIAPTHRHGMPGAGVTVCASPPPESATAVFAALKSPDPNVRAEAIEQAKQFDDPAVIPPLRDIAEQMENQQEQAALREAIAYIALPSLADQQPARRAERMARGLPDLPLSMTNRYTGRAFLHRAAQAE